MRIAHVEQDRRLVMKAIICLSLLGVALHEPVHLLAAPPAESISLFNGKDLSGWDGDPTRWSVRDGAITGQTTADRPLEHNTFLIWRGGTLEDFQLKLKFRIEGEENSGNSGIQYRSKELKELGKWVLGGYQADIDLTKKNIGILYEEKMRGIIGPRGQQVMLVPKTGAQPTAGKKKRRPKSEIRKTGDIEGVDEAIAKLEPGKWNTYVISARGRRLTHSINGQMTVQVVDKDSKHWAAKGLLGLQLHRGKPMTVQFKDITLRRFVKAPAPKKTTNSVGAQATPVDKVRVAKDFQVELVYSVPREKQGSWVCVTNDPRGRLIVGDQYGQLYRVTPPGLDGSADETRVESLTAEIGMAQGLLYAFDSLYVVVNGMRKRQSGLYRLRDTTGDDQFDEVKLLREFTGPTGEHGPHGIRLSPDGTSLYICAGNHTDVPELDRSRAPQDWQLDQLLPRLWDATGHATGILAPGGWICKTDPDGKEFELIGSGFRNEYDIAFNAEGELFTYDADMEWDIGAPWYRPTRVNHVTSGSEFGWRSGTGKWPSYYLDSLPAVVDIGPGSPTGITFGTGAKFPEKYQRALFIADWSYGVVYAVHMTPDGASFRGKAEQFVSAAALQVSDMVVNPADGALYFTVGGRETQSGLYRVRYTGQESIAAAGKQIDAGTTPRTQRRRLEALHGHQDPNAVRELWPFLGHPDRFIRFAARVALEHQPVDTWRKRAFRETEPQTMLSTLVAMTHQGTAADTEQALKSLAKLTWEELSPSQRLDMLRCYQLVLIRLGDPGQESAKKLRERLEPWYPSSDQAANRELCQLLVYLESPQVLQKTLELLSKAKTQEEQIHYALVLRNVKKGWQLDQRRSYFGWFERAAAHNGGHSFDGFLRNIRNDAIAGLTADERTALADILNRKPAAVEEPKPQRPIVKKWTVDDLLSDVSNPSGKRDLNRGRELFSEASCFKCHRLQGEGGYVGPDLTAAGRRFNAQNFLEAVLEPSRVISDQYQATMFLMNDGRTIVGRIVNLKGKDYRVRTDQLNPGVLTPVAFNEIEAMKPSPVSMMPAGLLDTYQKDEILDLIAYVRSVVNVDEQVQQPGDVPSGFRRRTKRAASKKRQAAKPNVVLIISDDQSWTDYSFMKHPVIKTPSLDQLARQSATFTRGYVPTALCRPSLATMITGLYAHQHKISGNDPAVPVGVTRQQLAKDKGYAEQRAKLISHIDKHATIPRLLQPAGYLSHQSGKWWEGSFQRGGFTHGMTRGFPKPGGRHGDDGLKIGRDGMKPVFDFMDMSIQEQKPFFVWYAPFLPHTPHNPPQRLLKKYQAEGRPIALAKYYAMCEWFDETCGQLLGYLDKKEITDNTLVIYVTDNGWIQRTPETKAPANWRGSYAPRSKQSPNEGGTRTPIMVRWPGKVKPATYDTLVSSIDIAPTIYAACGVKAPAGLPGVNLLDVCRHREANPSAADKRNVLFGESFAHDIANINRPAESLIFRWCIRDQWKLLLTYDGKVGRYAFTHLRTNREPQLYNLLEDPHENKNMAASNPEIVKQLTKLIEDSWDGK